MPRSLATSCDFESPPLALPKTLSEDFSIDWTYSIKFVVSCFF